MRKFYVIGLIILAVLIIGLAWAEQWTFSTYYPSPYGVYKEFTTTGKTCLATNPLPDPLNPLPDDDANSMVGIGTTNPQAKLEVRGGAIMATDGLIMEVRNDDPALPEPGRMFLVGATAIYTPEDLQNIRDNPSGNYYLAQNIDCSVTATWNGGWGFDPIDNFSGTLDGRDCDIINLYINRGSEWNVGLFGWLSAGATPEIKNVGLTGVFIKGYSRVGGLIGFGQSATINISNTSLQGVVMGNVNGIAGLIGVGTGATINIFNSHFAGQLSGTGNVGGLIGSGQSATINISNSSFAGDITAGQNNAAGFIGLGNTAIIDISNSSATGNITAALSGAAGLLSINYSQSATVSISNSYFQGIIWLTNPPALGGAAGGLVSTIAYGDIYISKSYSAAQILVGGPDYEIGGLIGPQWKNNVVSITDSFWDIDLRPDVETCAPIAGTPPCPATSKKSTAALQNVDTFTKTSTPGLSNPWDFVNNPNNDTGNEDFWTIDPLINDGYPYLLPVSAPSGGPYIDIGLRVHCGGSTPVKIAISLDQPPTSPLKIRKDGVTHGIALRSVGANEPGIKIRTNSELMALVEQ